MKLDFEQVADKVCNPTQSHEIGICATLCIYVPGVVCRKEKEKRLRSRVRDGEPRERIWLGVDVVRAQVSREVDVVRVQVSREDDAQQSDGT